MQCVRYFLREAVPPVLLLGGRQAAAGAVVGGRELVVAVGGGGRGGRGLVLAAAGRRTQVVGVVIVRWGLREKKGNVLVWRKKQCLVFFGFCCLLFGGHFFLSQKTSDSEVRDRNKRKIFTYRTETEYPDLSEPKNFSTSFTFVQAID